MAEHIILVAGPMGAGKTTSIQSLSGGHSMVTTEAGNTDTATVNKPTTTVAMDYSEILLNEDEKVRLYGLPGQRRFAFMWTILKKRATGMILLINNDTQNPIEEMLTFLEDFNELYDKGAIIIGISRSDIKATPNIDEYSNALKEKYPNNIVPIFTVDPREEMHMKKVLLSLVANLEFLAGFKEDNEGKI